MLDTWTSNVFLANVLLQQRGYSASVKTWG